MRAIAIAIAVALASVSTAHADDDADPANAPYDCLETWPPDMKSRPAFTCVSLTDRLLVSLQDASKADVVKALKANGLPVNDRGREILHFVSVAEPYSGDINFEIRDGRVIRIFGVVDDPNKRGVTDEFIWRPDALDIATHGPLGGACSDLPDSQYHRCNKQ